MKQYVWCGPCGQSRMYAVPNGEFSCPKCGAHTDPDLDLILDPGETWAVDSQGRLYGALPRKLTFVVRWESDREGVSYDLPSMLCTIGIPADLADSEALDLAYALVARRVAATYPTGPEGDGAIEPSWVFQDDALCITEAVFEGEAVAFEAWDHSERI